MVIIRYDEVLKIRETYKHRAILCTLSQKPASSRTYFLRNDDYDCLRIVAKLRGKTVKELVEEIKD